MEKAEAEILSSGLGKRKTSVAKIFLLPGSGMITINKKHVDDFFFSLGEEKDSLQQIFSVVHLQNQFDVIVDVKGGGIHSQLEAIHLAISKAICEFKTELRSTLQKHSFLTRDSRIKERRKYGLKKARKASQYSKR